MDKYDCFDPIYTANDFMRDIGLIILYIQLIGKSPDKVFDEDDLEWIKKKRELLELEDKMREKRRKPDVN